MKCGQKYFVRIDKKANVNRLDDSTRDAHFNYLKELAAITTIYAGGFEGAPGGMIVFSAKDFDDANTKCKNDPVIDKGFYHYELYEWTVQLTSPSETL